MAIDAILSTGDVTVAEARIAIELNDVGEAAGPRGSRGAATTRLPLVFSPWLSRALLAGPENCRKALIAFAFKEKAIDIRLLRIFLLLRLCDRMF